MAVQSIKLAHRKVRKNGEKKAVKRGQKEKILPINTAVINAVF